MIALEVRMQHAAEDAVSNTPVDEEIGGPDGITAEEFELIAEAAGLAAKLATCSLIRLPIVREEIRRLMHLIGAEDDGEA